MIIYIELLCSVLQRSIASYHRSRSLIDQLTMSLQGTTWWTSACRPPRTGKRVANCSAVKTCNHDDQPSPKPPAEPPLHSPVHSFPVFSLRVVPLIFNMCNIYFFFLIASQLTYAHIPRQTLSHTHFWHEIKFYSTNCGDVHWLNVAEIMARL